MGKFIRNGEVYGEPNENLTLSYYFASYESLLETMASLGRGCYPTLFTADFVGELTNGDRSASGKGLISKASNTITDYDFMLLTGTGGRIYCGRISEDVLSRCFSYSGNSVY